MGIVESALSWVGKVKYVFGANDIPGGKGDCSAFTQYIYNQHGYKIGRDTRSQLAQGTAIEKNALQPGDLVFFEGTYREGVSHVGIYIGNGNMVNLKSAGVCIDTIESGYWSNHYMAARRVADNADAGGDSQTIPVINTGTVSLDWWGDIVVILFVIVCAFVSIFFLYKTFSVQIGHMIGDGTQVIKTVSKAVGGE